MPDVKNNAETQIDDICGLYAAAYGDSGLTAEEIFDEILCDAMGEMNAFATEGQEKAAGAVGLFLRDVARAEENSQAKENAAEDSGGENTGGTHFSIVQVVGEKDVYDNCVMLDTNLFDGIKPRNWGKVLEKFVYENLADKELTVFDSEGNKEIIRTATGADRVSKNGKRSRKVLDEMAQVKGDNTKSLAIVHLDELARASKNSDISEERSHGWLDENGWVLREVYLCDRNGKIYSATLNIANSRKGQILYAISKIKRVDAAKVSSTQDGRDEARNINSGDRISHGSESVKNKTENHFSREMESVTDLKEENKHLKERVEFWKEQAHPSKGARANKQDVREAAKQLKNAYGSKTSTDQVARQIQDLADYIISNDNDNGADFAEVKKKAEEAARLILDGCSVNVNEYTADIWHGVKRFLKNRKITVTARMKEAVPLLEKRKEID